MLEFLKEKREDRESNTIKRPYDRLTLIIIYISLTSYLFESINRKKKKKKRTIDLLAYIEEDIKIHSCAYRYNIIMYR